MDGSGTLSLAEVRKMLVKLNLSKEEVDAMMLKLDENQDGNVLQSFHEDFLRRVC